MKRKFNKHPQLRHETQKSVSHNNAILLATLAESFILLHILDGIFGVVKKMLLSILKGLFQGQKAMKGL